MNAGCALGLEDKRIYDVGREIQQGNKDIPLGVVVAKFKKRTWQEAPFQREFVWSSEQIKGWILSLICGESIGVIVTYQLEADGPTYIADGLQRITATAMFLENPETYNSTSQKAENYCDSFSITVQHRKYKNHEEAMSAFQKLNCGTALTPEEFYKGTLILTSGGKIVQQQIPAITQELEGRLVRNKPKSKSMRGKYIRDAYSLWIRYITGDRVVAISGGGGSSKINTDTAAIEEKVAAYIKNKPLTEIERLIKSYRGFMETTVTEIIEIMEQAGAKGYSIPPGLMRTLFHLRLWMRNNNLSFAEYKNITTLLFTRMIKKYGHIAARIEYKKEDGSVYLVNFTMDKMPLSAIEAFIGQPIGQSRRRTKNIAAPGYNVSHVLPLAEFGEGPTVMEPAHSNQARGAKMMESSIDD